MDYTSDAEWSLLLYLFPQLFIDVLKLDPQWAQCFLLCTALLPRLCSCPDWRCESAADSAQSTRGGKKQLTWGSVFFRSLSPLFSPHLVTVWLSHNQRLTDTHIDLSMKDRWGGGRVGPPRQLHAGSFLRWFDSVSTLYGSSKWIICDPG